MVIVTHEIGFAREVADNIVFMEGGKIVASGPSKTVLDNAENVRVRSSCLPFCKSKSVSRGRLSRLSSRLSATTSSR